MPCNCNYNWNDRVLFSTVGTVTIETASVQLTPDHAIIPDDYQRVGLVITSNAGKGSTLPVTVVINGTPVPLYDKAGNQILGITLPTRFKLKCYFGSNGADGEDHLIAINTPFIRN